MYVRTYVNVRIRARACVRACLEIVNIILLARKVLKIHLSAFPGTPGISPRLQRKYDAFNSGEYERV